MNLNVFRVRMYVQVILLTDGIILPLAALLERLDGRVCLDYDAQSLISSDRNKDSLGFVNHNLKVAMAGMHFRVHSEFGGSIYSVRPNAMK